MKFRYAVQGLMVLMVSMTGCGARFAQPTATPTVTLPPLDSTATIDPLPPTPISDEAAFRSGAGINNPTAAAAPNNSETNPDSTLLPVARSQLVTIDVSNGGLLNGEIYRPTNLTDGARVPGILLLDTPLDDWSGLPVILRDSGYTVLVIEPRIPPVEGDFTAIFATLASDTSVDPERMAMGGGETGADLVFLGCALAVGCDAAFLLTPLDGDNLIANTDLFGQRALLVIASSQDPVAAQTGEAITQAARGASTFFPFDEPRRGTQMLGNRPDLSGYIADWLRQTLR